MSCETRNEYIVVQKYRYNRYSSVWNNPLSHTDPKAWILCRPVVLEADAGNPVHEFLFTGEHFNLHSHE